MVALIAANANPTSKTTPITRILPKSPPDDEAWLERAKLLSAGATTKTATTRGIRQCLTWAGFCLFFAPKRNDKIRSKLYP